MKKATQLENIDEMDNKLKLIIDIIDRECNHDGIIIDYDKYLQILGLSDDIIELSDDIKIKTEITEKIYLYLEIINKDFLKINKKYYYEEPYI
jgi:hypothetical protein